MVSQCDESIIRAAFATAGSLETYLTNLSISLVLSSIASSMLMSMMLAPSSICFAAIWSASSYCPSEISLANFLDPATLVLSPTFVKLFLLTSTLTASRPLTFNILSVKKPAFPDGKPFSVASSGNKPVFPDDMPYFCVLSGKKPAFPDSIRGLMPFSASAIARICSGVVPQHPPAIFSNPFSAMALTAAPISAGLWSYPPISLGRPALG